MQSKKHTTPFEAYLGKDKDGLYGVRLGPKIYLVNISLDFTPGFDKEFFGGNIAPEFNWESILVKDNPGSEARPISDLELSVYWFKGALKKAINYQRTKERNARNSQTSRYSANQRTAYHNENHNKGL